MYIKRIVARNLGPISKLNIEASFLENGEPKPIILVGENGSGKSTLISNIVDSFYELAGKCYGNAIHHNENGNGYQFFKIISGMQIKNGERFLFSRIEFDNNVDYCFKAGDCPFEQFKEESGFEGNIPDWSKEINKKHIQGLNDKETEKTFSESVICYFGPERYEKPSWMGELYYDDMSTHLSVEPQYNGKLRNPIMACNMGKENFRWLLDVIVDSRTDVEDHNGELQSVHVDIRNLMAMSRARLNVESIMSTILSEEVYFGLNLRRDGGARFNIIRRKDDSLVAPSMDSLSTGQLALFDIFSTIIRYADNNDISKSIHLNQIKGIVVIDEVELHLHSIHQKEVLPHLIRLFPNVQFVITTHSPLFLLGMEKEYGPEGFDIYQMPDGTNISAERFSEFDKAYLYFSETERHQRELVEALKQGDSDSPIIITEGATDWKHLIAAYNDLSIREEYKDLFTALSFDFFKYEPLNSSKEAENKIEMGNKPLVAMCESFSKMPQKRKMLFIADCDDKETNKRMTLTGSNYKAWGNNVYSFVLPVPESRKETPEICIEHLYSDEEIRTEYIENGIPRRLYLGYEFNNKGISKELGKMCEKRNVCGDGKITIIEGSSGEKVTEVYSDDDINYALPKMKFAECVLNKENGFDKFDFSNFVKVFEIIREILMSSEENA